MTSTKEVLLLLLLLQQDYTKVTMPFIHWCEYSCATERSYSASRTTALHSRCLTVIVLITKAEDVTSALFILYIKENPSCNIYTAA